MRLVDPELAAIAEQMPRSPNSDPEQVRIELRELYKLSGGRPRRSWHDRVDIEAATIPGPDGNTIPIRIYTPAAVASPRGCLVHFHGGGFISGDLEVSEDAVGRYADKAGVTVVDVDYRLAPEDGFPAGFEDCYTALAWTAVHADGLGIDADRIAVGGNSAGGGLAASVALAARDRGGPPLAFQLLIYPVLDDRLTTQSVRAMTDTPMWDAPSCVRMWQHYLGDRAGGADVSPYAAPMRAADKPDGLAGLPPAYVLACELDPLRDEDIAYAVALMSAGVSADLRVAAGTYHGFDEMAAAISKRTTAEIAETLRRAIGTP
jgi:acetyl esterase/lipase